MRSHEFRGVVTALSSIAHSGGESFGINTKFRREKFVMEDGSVEEIPVISGNSVRGVLRDVGMKHLCMKLGYGMKDDGKIVGLSLPAFYFLFSGGSLTSTGGDYDMDRARKLAELVPLIKVFGGAMGNAIMPGKLKIGKMIPICSEMSHLLPDGHEDDKSIWEMLQEEMYVRKDDEKDEHLRRLVEPKWLALKAGKKLNVAQEQKSLIETDEGEEKKWKAGPQQMMYYVETLAAGTKFYWEIIIDDATDLEFEAFLTTLLQFSRMPYVGGNSRIGLGKVKVEFDKWLTIDPHVVDESKAVVFEIGQLYEKHLREKAEQIKEELTKIK